MHQPGDSSIRPAIAHGLGARTGGSNDNAADQATNYMKVWDSPGDGPPSDFRLIVPQAIPENGGRRGKARTR